MEEKRKSRRMVLNAHLVMKKVGETEGMKLPVDIIDISKEGMGFRCEAALAMNSIYEMDLMLWTKDVIHTFVNITRYDGNKNMYGAIFTGMNENDSSKIRIYEMFDRAQKEL